MTKPTFRDFLKESFRFIVKHKVTVHYFGETSSWMIIGSFITWMVFPDSFVKSNPDLRGFWIMIPFGIWALLRGIFILWRSDK